MTSLKAVSRKDILRIAVLVFLFSIPFTWSYYPIPFTTHQPPSGTIRQIDSSGQIREWQILADTQATGLGFTLQSGTSTRRIEIRPDKRNALLRVKKADITTDIGKHFTVLECADIEGSMWDIPQYRFLSRRRLPTSFYFGDIKIQCTDPSEPGTRIEGDLSFSRLRAL